MLKENQAALDAGNAALTTLLEESKAEVSTLESATEGQEHSPGLSEEAMGRFHEQLTAADLVDVSGLRAQCGLLDQRLEDMKEQNKRITEQKESIEASNTAAQTAIASQADESAKIEETRTNVEEQLQPVKSATSDLNAKLAELETQTEALVAAKAATSNIVEVEYSERWQEAAKDVHAAQRGLVDARKQQLERARRTAAEETKQLYRYGATAMAEAFGQRRLRYVPTHTLGAFKASRQKTQHVAAATCRLQRLLTERLAHALDRWRSGKDLEKAVAAKCEAVADLMPRAATHLADVQWPAAIEAIEARSAAAEGGLVSAEDSSAYLVACERQVLQLAAPLADEAEDLLAARRKHIEQVSLQLASSQADFKACADRIEILVKDCSDTMTQATLLAEQAAVKSVMEDVLLLWSSVKSLDACKADRRDLAQLVELEQERSLETSAKIAAFDDEGAKAFASAVETLGNHLNGAEHSLAPVVASHSEKFRALQDVLRRLSVYIEEMVTKLTELSAQSKSRLRPGAMTRTGGGYRQPTMKRTGQPVRSPAPPLLDAGASLEEGCNRWREYAKAMLEDTNN